MEKLSDTTQFALQLPIWVIMHPKKKNKGYVAMTGQAGHSVMPLFTEEGLAQRYRDGAPQLSQFLVGRAGDSGEITQVINSMEGQGFTHAAIDPTTKRGILFAIDQLRCVAAQFKQNPPARDAQVAAKDV
jgi:hypothetical protein